MVDNFIKDAVNFSQVDPFHKDFFNRNTRKFEFNKQYFKSMDDLVKSTLGLEF